MHRFCTRLAALLLAFLLFVCPLAGTADVLPESGLDIYFLSVGNADATLVFCDGRSLLIDGGDRDSNQYIYAIITKYFNLDHLDFIISTHPDADHVYGLSAAINAVAGRVGTIWWNGLTKETKAFTGFLTTLEKFSLTPVKAVCNTSFSLGSAQVTFISPLPGLCSEDGNDFSLVPLITYGDTRFLIAADMTLHAEHALCSDDEADLHADVLRVAHHGAEKSSCDQFLQRVSPAYAVISTGSNSYGHPHAEVLSRLADLGCTVYRTDLDGTVHCHSDGYKLAFFFDEGL